MKEIRPVLKYVKYKLDKNLKRDWQILTNRSRYNMNGVFVINNNLQIIISDNKKLKIANILVKVHNGRLAGKYLYTNCFVYKHDTSEIFTNGKFFLYGFAKYIDEETAGVFEKLH